MTDDAIIAAASKAAEELDEQGGCDMPPEVAAAIIARHYRDLIAADIEYLSKAWREQSAVRELVLRARPWAEIAQPESMDEYRARKDALRISLVPFEDVK